MYTAEVIQADFKTFPYRHQLEELELHGMDKKRMLLWQPRSGKSKTVIDTAGMLWAAEEIHTVILIAPNGVHLNWPQRELPFHHWENIPYDTCAWKTDIAGKSDSAKLRKGWKEQNEAWWKRAERCLATKKLAWFFFAAETMTRDDVRKLVARIYRRRKGKILIVFDECHDFRTPGSKRGKMARAMANKAQYRRTLTGTPLDNSPLHAWAQYELLEKGALGYTRYSDFKDRYAEYEKVTTKGGRTFPQLVDYKHLDEMRDRMAPMSSVVLRSDCVDLPDLVPIIRTIELTEEQKKVYADLHETYELEINGEEVIVGDENTQRFIKIQQTVSGFVKNEWGEVVEIVKDEDNPRLQALVEEVEMNAGKSIIWCNFHEDMDRVAKALRARGHKIVEYHGRVKPSEKDKARKALAPEAENDVKALVGYPTPGLNLSGADKIINYSHTFDAIKKGQADERATAIGGKNVPVVEFVGGPVDEYIVENVKKKMSLGDSLSRDGMAKVLRRISL